MVVMASVKRDVIVVNASGMHLRPAAAFVQAANRHRKCDIFVTRDGQRVNGKSIMGLVMLAAAKDTLLTIECNGEGAQGALDELCALVENKFGIDS
jgi:phosphocarrier protein HPr